MPYVGDNWIIWHVPKCGGTWCKAVLKKAEIKHEVVSPGHGRPADLTAILVGRQHAVTVRDPQDWYWSVYCHLVDHAIKFDDPARGSVIWGPWNVSRRQLDNFGTFLYHHAGKYSSFLYQYAGWVDVKVLRTSHLSVDLFDFLMRTGAIDSATVAEAFNMDRVNETRSTGRFWQDPTYTREQAKAICDLDGYAYSLIRKAANE